MTLARLPWSFCSILTLSRGLLLIKCKRGEQMNVQTLLKFYNCRSELHLLFYAFYYSNTNVYGFIQLYRGDLCLYIYYCLYLLCIFVVISINFWRNRCKIVRSINLVLHWITIQLYTVYWGFLEYNFATFIIFFRRTLRVDWRGDPGKSVMNDAALSYMSINNNHRQTTWQRDSLLICWLPVF